MCGRFVLFTTGDELLERIGTLPGISNVHAPDATPPPRYNIAPTQNVPIVRVRESLAQVDPARWGLIPHWKKDTTGAPLFNARGETIHEKPSFRDAFRAQRCLMVLDGYYEWHTENGKKTPYYVRLGDASLLYAAGLWSTGLNLLSTTMVTTSSAGPIEWLHHRLPRFLLPEEITTWLHGTPAQAQQLLHPTPLELLEQLEWSPADGAVGNVRNDYPELIENPGLF